MAQEILNEEEITKLKSQCEEYLAGWKRERADFINYKKEEAERISGFMKYANEEIVLKILPVLDNLLLAQVHINDVGLLQVIKQFEDLLQKEGVEPIKTIGEKFDANLMEAVADTSDLAPSSDGATTVVAEIQRGYMFNGKLLRPAKVKITK